MTAVSAVWLALAGRVERHVAAELAAVVRLLTLIAVAVLPIALTICAAQALAANDHGACGLGPGTSGWLSAGLYAVAAALGLRLAWVGIRLWRTSRAALVRTSARCVADRMPLEDGFAALVVPLTEPVAYTAGLSRPQIVISQGLLEILDRAERRALLAHELAHARSGHQRMLFVGGVVAEAFRFLPPVRKLFASLRRQLEAAADDQALASIRSPSVLAQAIAKAALAAAPVGASALAGGSELRYRLARLERRVEPSLAATLLASGGGAVVATAIMVSACLALHAGVLLASIALCLSGLGALTLPALIRRQRSLALPLA